MIFVRFLRMFTKKKANQSNVGNRGTEQKCNCIRAWKWIEWAQKCNGARLNAGFTSMYACKRWLHCLLHCSLGYGKVITI